MKLEPEPSPVVTGKELAVVTPTNPAGSAQPRSVLLPVGTKEHKPSATTTSTKKESDFGTSAFVPNVEIIFITSLSFVVLWLSVSKMICLDTLGHTVRT